MVAALTTVRMVGAAGVGLADELFYALRCTPPRSSPASSEKRTSYLNGIFHALMGAGAGETTMFTPVS